jgi:hypothetical protein
MIPRATLRDYFEVVPDDSNDTVELFKIGRDGEI